MMTPNELRTRATELRDHARKAREMASLLDQPQVKQELTLQAEELEKRAASLEEKAGIAPPS